MKTSRTLTLLVIASIALFSLQACGSDSAAPQDSAEKKATNKQSNTKKKKNNKKKKNANTNQKASVLLEDNFNRKDSDKVGNNWVTTAEGASAAYIQKNELFFETIFSHQSKTGRRFSCCSQ